MKKLNLLSTSAIGSAALFGMAIAFASPAYAQDGQDSTTQLDTEQEIESGVAAEEGETLVVTGSRIRRPNLESNVPVTSLGGEEFFQQGTTNVGDALNELPALRSTFGQSNAGRFLGTTGLNLLDLRGLGTQRTLVLVNGRRHVASDILSNAVSPDVNTIPTDLIERVDVVTGGNSAIYGSDAIAGVVNFILRRDFEGIQVRGHAAINRHGAAGNQYVSAMYGTNFADGRGNITVHAEYAHQERTYASDYPFLLSNDNFLTVDTDPGGTPNGSDGFPDRVFFRDIRRASIHQFGLVPITQPAGAGAQCGTGINNLPYNCTYIFQADGTLVPQTGTRVGTGIIGSIVGGNGDNGREGNQLTVFPFQERFNVNLLAHFTISDAFEPFIEAKFVRVNTQGQQSSPAFVQGVTFGDPREEIRLDNPYLNPAARTTITNAILASGFNPSLVARQALTAGDLAAIADGSYRFVIARSTLDLGVRDEKSQRDTFRIVGGLRGTFNDDWNYELSVNYGRFEEETTILGNINQQRFILALDAGLDPATGTIRCRSQFDPAAALPYDGIPAGADTLAADIAACVPYNPFGAGDNSAARAYIVQDTVSRAELEQVVVNGFVSGDSSQLFELPGGPVSFALGAEYRREQAFYQADPLVEQGFTFYNALPTFSPPPFDVKEAFAEIRIPILANMTMFEELTVTGAARVADYGGGTGTVFAYNAGVEWAPVRDIRFRGNYGRSVRAPNVSETSTPLTQNFAPGFQDPCRPQNIGQNPNRPANCQADLGALLDDADFQSLPNYSLEILSGSNPGLQEETSDSWTVGAIIQPRWVPGLSITVDYFDITVDDVISSINAQTIVNTCYDLPSLDNPFCDLIERYRGAPGTTGPSGEVPGQILDGTLIAAPLNFASLKRRGLDFEVAYRRSFGPDASVSTRLIYTHQLQNSNFTNPSLPDFENRIMTELGDPQDEFRWNLDVTLQNVTLGYEMRYIGKQVTNLYEDFFSVQGRAPNDADWSDVRFYPSVLYHDVRVDIEASRDFNVYVGVDNVTDRRPPLGLTGIGAGSGIYNIRGRNFFAGFRARF